MILQIVEGNKHFGAKIRVGWKIPENARDPDDQRIIDVDEFADGVFVAKIFFGDPVCHQSRIPFLQGGF